MLNNKTTLKLLLYFLSLFVFIHPDFAALELIFETEKLSMEDKSAGNNKTGTKLHVIVQKNLFICDDGVRKKIYDLAKHRIFIIDPEKKAYEDYSLFTLLGFRTAEIQNRLSILDAVKNGSADYLQPALIENMYSLRSGRQTTEIHQIHKKNRTIYMSENKILMETAQTGKEISKEDTINFFKFIRYYIGGHPEILKSLANQTLIPGSITYYDYASPASKFVINLVSIKNVADTQYSLEGFSSNTSISGNGFIRYVNEAAANTEKLSGQRIATIQAEIKDSLDRSQYLEALLGCMESGLYNSSFDLEICKTNMTNLQKDVNVKIFFNNLNIKTVPASQAFEHLKSIEPYAGNKAYVLWVFEAVMKSKMGDSTGAYELFYNALKQNPFITGVYKDLGELFFNNYQMGLAWLCWDTGRKIYPQHSMLKEINQFEENLQKKYPEYF